MAEEEEERKWGGLREIVVSMAKHAVRINLIQNGWLINLRVYCHLMNLQLGKMIELIPLIFHSDIISYPYIGLTRAECVLFYLDTTLMHAMPCMAQWISHMSPCNIASRQANKHLRWVYLSWSHIHIQPKGNAASSRYHYIQWTTHVRT